jgi:hypothetical protein
MVSPVTNHTEKNSGNNRSFLDIVFLYVERFAYNHSWLVILVSLALAGLSLWYTAENLQFKTNRRDLVSKNLKFDKLYQEYREKFKDFDGVTVVVEGENTDQMKAFAERLVEKLKNHSGIYSEIYYKIDVDYFRDKALLYLKDKELRELEEKIRSHLDFIERVEAAPGLSPLLKAINAEISAGMVDTLMSGFFGNDGGKKEGDDSGDLNLLISILKQMSSQLNGDTRYRSPWMTMLAEREETLTDQGYLASDDDSLLFILMSPHQDVNNFTGSKQAIDALRKIIGELKPQFPAVRVGVTGSDVIATDEMVTTQEDVNVASALALVGCAVLFIVVYRGVVKPLLAVFCLLIALAWTMGYATLVVGHLNILSVVFVSILIGLGIDSGIHILERYREERAFGYDILQSLVKTLQGTGRGNFAGAVTICISFGSMIFTDFTGIAELGIISSGGIILCFIVMILTLPAMVTLEERWRKHSDHANAASEETHGQVERIFDHYYWIIAVSTALIIISLMAFPGTKFDYNLLHLQAKGTEAVQYELKILDSAKRSTWYAAVTAPSLEEAIKKEKMIKTMPSIGKVESIVSVIPEQQEEKIRRIRDLAPLLEGLRVPSKNEPVILEPLVETMRSIRFKLQEREGKDGSKKLVAEAGQWAQKFLDDFPKIGSEVARQRLEAFSTRLFLDYRKKIEDLKAGAHPTPVQIENLPELLKVRFMSKNNEYLILAYPNINIWERHEMEEFLNEMRAIDPNVTGNAVHMFESSQLMKNGYIHGGLYAMTAIFVFIFISFKSLKTTLLILLPTLVGTILTVGQMRLIGVQFNLANLVILPLIIGIGVAHGIHIVHRYQEEADKDGAVLSKSTGQAVVLSTLTDMIGFGTLMVADHQGIFSLGLVLTLGVGNAMLASLTLLPALLRWSFVRGWKV